MDIASEKKRIRKMIGERLAAFDEVGRGQFDVAICNSLLQWLLDNARGKTVLAYFSMADEPLIVPVLENWLELGEQLILPRVEKDGRLSLHLINNMKRSLRPGAYGIPEPSPELPEVAEHEIDFAIVPGRAFTLSGERLGRGGGFYDRLLEDLRAVKIAALYDCQLLDGLPCESHDRRVDFLIIGNRLVDCRGENRNG